MTLEALKSFGATLVSGAMVLGTAFGMSIGIIDAPSSCLLLPTGDGNSYALNVVWASTPEGDVALVRIDGLVYAIPADDLPSRTRPSDPPSVSSLSIKAIPNNKVAQWYDADPADAIPKKALPGAFVAELDLPAGQRVSLGATEGLGTWAKLGGEVGLVLNDGGVFWAIPSNVVRSAIPHGAIPSNAIPAEAIPSNAIPSNAIPSNLWTRALPGKWLAEINLAAGERVILEPNRGGWSTPTSGVWSMAGDQPAVVVKSGELLWAIPSNAGSLAIPSNLRPSKAIPSNAIPAEAIPSNAIPSNLVTSVLNDAAPGKWLAEAGLAAGELVALQQRGTLGVGAWAMAGNDPALVVKAGDLMWAIPSNETSPDWAIPSNLWPTSALPASAIPSNAIPSNAIPSNLKASLLNEALDASVLAEAHLRAGGIARIGGQGVVFTWVQDIRGIGMALPASALPASALPASIVGDTALLLGSDLVDQALPASALPASALPASALPASALPASALPSNLSALLLPMDQALARGDAALPASALPAAALPASAVSDQGLSGAFEPVHGVSWLRPRTDDATVIRGSVVDPTIRGSIIPGTPPVPRDQSGADARGCTPVERFAVAVSGGGSFTSDGTFDSWWNTTLVRVEPPRHDGTIQASTGTRPTVPPTVPAGTEVDTDLDNDGYDGTAFGGLDCNDADRTIRPGAIDVPGDGIDQDCDGVDATDPGQEFGEDTDKDDDGHQAVKFGGDDCNDTNAAIHPDAIDTPGDGIDQDCDGVDATKSTTNPDTDGDGYVGTDCNNNDPTIHPGATDIPGDGIDQDCDGKDATTDDSVPPPPPAETLVISAVEVYGSTVIEESLISGGAQYCDSPFETWIDAWMDREVDGTYVATGPSDLGSVWMSWKIGGLVGSTEMQYLQTDLWSAQFGPFDADTISGSDTVVTITVTMTRLNGTTDTGTTQVTLRDCDPPLEG